MKVAALVAAGLILAIVLLAGTYVAANWAPERSVADLKVRWAPPPSQFVEIMGMQVHLRDEGPRDDPSSIVLIYGTGSSLHAWEPWAKTLKGQRRIITFDLPGFGLTGPAPDANYTMENTVRFVIAVLDKLGVQKCVLGGNSLGGSVSWVTGLLHPERVEKLILVDAGGYRTQSISVPLGFRLARMPVINQILTHTLPRNLIESGWRDVYGDPSKVTAEQVDRSYELTSREGNRTAFVQRASQPRSSGLAERIPQIKVPTLIMWGGRDRLIPPENAERFHRDIKGSELVIFDDLGHAPEEEDPARTVAAVKKFLDLP